MERKGKKQPIDICKTTNKYIGLIKIANKQKGEVHLEHGEITYTHTRQRGRVRNAQPHVIRGKCTIQTICTTENPESKCHWQG